LSPNWGILAKSGALCIATRVEQLLHCDWCIQTEMPSDHIPTWHAWCRDCNL